MAGETTTAEETKRVSWRKRLLIGPFVLIGFLIIAAFIARIFIGSNAGANFIEKQLNARNLGPLERVEISGLEGDVLGDFSIHTLKLYDKDGQWGEASNISVQWAPWGLWSKKLNLERVNIKRSEILRRPVLNKSEKKASSPYRVNLAKGNIDRLLLSEQVLGRAATLRLGAKLQSFQNGLITGTLDVKQLENGEDTLFLDFERKASGNILGKFNLEGAPDGTLATVLKAPAKVKLMGKGQISGRSEKGDGNLIISFNGKDAVDLKTDWGATTASINGRLSTTNWPLFDKVRQGLGQQLDINLTAERDTASPNFTANLESKSLSLIANGKLDDGFKPPQSFTVKGSTDNIGALLPLPNGYSAKAGSLDGLVRLGEQRAFDGKLSLATLKTPYASLSTVSGPLSITQKGEKTYSLKTTLNIKDLDPKIENPIVLAKQSKLTFETQLDLDTRRASAIKASFASGQNTVTLNGRASLDASTFDLAGKIKSDIQAYQSLPSGELQTQYRVQKTRDSLPALTADGAFLPISDLPPPLDTLIATGLNFDVAMSPIENGLRVSRASFRSENATLAAEGTLTDRLNITGEALLNEAVSYNNFDLSGMSEASFTLTGARKNPSLKIDVRTERVVTPQAVLENPRLRADLTTLISSPKGPLRLTADTDYGPLDAELMFASNASQYIAERINLSLGDISVKGTLAISQTGLVNGELKAVLPETNSQYADLVLSLDTVGDTQNVGFTADAQNIAYGAFNIDEASANLSGTLEGLGGEIALSGSQDKGVVQRDFNLLSDISFARLEDKTYELTLLPKASYGPINLTAQNPITARYQEGDLAVDADITLAEAPVSMRYTLTDGAEQLNVEASNILLRQLPLPPSLRNTAGQLTSRIDLTSNPQTGVSGQVETSLSNWRGVDARDKTALAGTLNLELAGAQANWQLDMKDKADFIARGQGTLNILPTDKIVKIRPNMEAAMTGDFNSEGSIQSLLALFTPDDARPKGTLQASLSIAGTPKAPQIDGQAQGRNIQLEAPQLGTRLKDGRFTLDFSNQGFAVQDVYVSDSKGGTLSGDGAFELGDFGRPIGEVSLKAEDFVALNRRDFEGRVSGTMGYQSAAERSLIKGDLILARTEVKQFATARASVIEIPVTEINVPKSLERDVIDVPALPIDLDIKVNAPRRVFVRSRGLDVELSVDATIKGTLEAPEIIGEANVLRGGYKLAGKELAFETGRIIFNGPLTDARVNLVARTETPTLSAEVNITGTVEKPEIELSSTPERPQDEVLSALLFGRSVTELSTLEAAQLAGALAQFSGGGGGFNLLGGLRDALGVNQLSIGVGNDGAAQIAGGRYLAKNVYLQVFSGADTSQTGAIIDWEIRKNISLRSRVQADNDQSFSLKWKRDF